MTESKQGYHLAAEARKIWAETVRDEGEALGLYPIVKVTAEELNNFFEDEGMSVGELYAIAWELTGQHIMLNRQKQRKGINDPESSQELRRRWQRGGGS